MHVHTELVNLWGKIVHISFHKSTNRFGTIFVSTLKLSNNRIKSENQFREVFETFLRYHAENRP